VTFEPVQQELRGLLPIVREALPRMFEPSAGLFCYREKRSGDRLQREGTSVRYSAMCVIGLGTAGDGLSSLIDVPALMAKLEAQTEYVPGDAGLVAWAAAIVDPENAPRMYARAFGNAEELAALPTMETAWLLTAAAEAIDRKLPVPGIEQPARAMAEQLERAWNRDTGLFYRSARTGSAIRNIASFATQIYPVYGLAVFARATGDAKAATMATKCADRLCALQESDGGWSWLYDVDRGTIVDAMPIYSVHQEGMAPMALLQLQRATGKPYAEQAAKGVSWLRGPNPMRMSMVDETWRTIWRAQESRLPLGVRSVPVNAIGAKLIGRPIVRGTHHHLVDECRPYELGWLLNAAFL